jgi:hypothetical protein
LARDHSMRSILRAAAPSDLPSDDCISNSKQRDFVAKLQTQERIS